MYTYIRGLCTPTSPSALSPRLVEKERRRDADVERLDAPEQRDRNGVVAVAPHERPKALPLGAEDEREAAREVGLPHRGRGAALGGEHPEVAALHLGEVAGEVRHDRDGQVLDRAG